MALIVSVLFIVFSLATILWYVDYYRNNKSIRNLKSPFFLPIFGNTYYPYKTTDVLPYIKKWFDKYGSVFKFWKSSKVHIVICDGKLIDKLKEQIVKDFDYYFLRPWLGQGLLIGTGKHWQKQRKLVNSTLHQNVLGQFLDIFDAQSNTLIKKLKPYVGKGFFDITDYVVLCGLDIICETTMGVTVGAQEDGNPEYVRSLKLFCKHVVERTLSAYKRSNFLYSLTNSYREDQEALKVLHGFSNSIIMKKSNNKTEVANEILSEGENGLGIKQKPITLDLLLNVRENDRPLSYEFIREIVDTVAFAGHDTSSTSICFTTYLLANHLDIQAKVADELREIFRGDKDRPTTQDDLKDMKYLEMVIKESLRLYPVAPHFGRKLTQDIEYDNFVIKKDTNVKVMIFHLHRNPKVFPDPEKFDPDRFLPENCAKRTPYDYIPFGYGLRTCVGQRYAMLELKMVMSKLLRHFKVLPKPGFEPILSSEIVLSSENGFWLQLEEREL